MGEQQSNPYRDLPLEVRLICARGDVEQAIEQVCATWGLDGPQALTVSEAALGTLRSAVLDQAAANLARAYIAAGPTADGKSEGEPSK